VADLIASHGRLDALVRGLLAAEAWRERVLPHLRPRLLPSNKGGSGGSNSDDDDNTNGCDSWVAYCALRHEAALANLLELCLFRAGVGASSGAATASATATPNDQQDPLLLMGEAERLELADWCVRRLRHLALLRPESAGSTRCCHPIARAGAWRRELLREAVSGGGGKSNNDDNPEARVRALAAAARALLDAPPELELDDRVVETEFQASLCALGLTRWLADAACCAEGVGRGGSNSGGQEPHALALLSRLVGRPSASGGDDAVTLLAELLERPPWERPSEAPGVAVERYSPSLGSDGDDGDGALASSSSSSSWSPVPVAQRHLLAPQAAQAWLALCRLLCEPAARGRWLAASGGGAALAAVLRLRRPLASPLLLDQAPFLVPLGRAVEALAGLGSEASGGGSLAASLSPMLMVVEPLPGVRDALIAEARRAAGGAGGGRGDGWARVLAAAQAHGAFSSRRSREAAQARAASMVQAFEYLAASMGGGEGVAVEEGEKQQKQRRARPAKKAAVAATDGNDDTAAAADGDRPTSAHVTCWRLAGADMWEPWCDFEYRVDGSKAAEEVTVAGGGAGAARRPGASATPATSTPLRGVRRRLLPVDPKHSLPLPCEGKVAVRVGDRVAEARLSLPALHSRGDGDGDGESATPASVWVTVGELARDGFVLQMRLARKPPAGRERDRSSGVWYAYGPAGGALTTTATATVAAEDAGDDE
jgi:hypothetical protein